VGVLLRLGDAQLLFAVLGEELAEGHGELLGRVSHGDVGHGRVVLRHADVVQREEAVPALEAGEFRIDEGAGDLAGAVRAEVEKDDAVAGLDGALFIDDGGQDELVREVLARLVDGFVGSADGRDRVVSLDALAIDNGGIGLLQRSQAKSRSMAQKRPMVVATLPTPIFAISSTSCCT
jgi:hypothetical protein